MRRKLSEDLNEQIFELMLFCRQSHQAMADMRLSASRDLFASKAFASWKKASEHEMKLTGMVIDRLDGLAKRFDGLAKMLAKRH